MPLPRKTLAPFVLGLVLTTFLFGSTRAFAIEEDKPIHFSGDRQVWDRKTNQVELFGHASVTQPGETLTADHIHLDKTTRVLDATGHCVYISGETFMWGDQMHFDLNTRAGTIIAGRVSNDRFTLRGEEIEKIGPGHFKTKWGDYTTCRDCAASWSFLAEDVDMELEGYAYLNNVTTRIKGAPALWLPYLIMPLKTQRQTGFLPTPIAFGGGNGFSFVLPFFWAIDRSVDMTFGAGVYLARGPRASWETRYNLGGRSAGTSNVFYQAERNDVAATLAPTVKVPHRWSVAIAQTQELGWGVEEKLRFAEVSDNLYPFTFPGDVPGAGEAFLPSTLSLSKTSDNYSGYVAFNRYRNLLNTTPNDKTEQIKGFDSRTVQVFPKAVITANDHFFWDHVAGGVSLGLDHFTRTSGDFDFDKASVPFGTPTTGTSGAFPSFTAGRDPIRKAVRFSMVPSLYATLRLFDVISVVPSLQYRGYFYNFGSLARPLSRGYLLFQTDLLTQFEKVMDYPETPDIPKVKHLVRPLLTYSLIPLRAEDESHPFSQQISNGLAAGTPGYYFDNNDIVPYTFTPSNARFFAPLGHSLSYGLTTQWVRRRGKVTDFHPKAETMVEWSAGQTVNFLEIFHPLDQNNAHPLTRFFSSANLNLDRFVGSATYYYYPDVDSSTPRHVLSTSATVIFERSVRQSVLEFDRSFSLGYTFDQINNKVSNLTANMVYSLNDYLMPNIALSYNFMTKSLFAASSGLRIQSPSRCWWIFGGIGYRVETKDPVFSFDWKLNLSGGGFNSVSEVANRVAGS